MICNQMKDEILSDFRDIENKDFQKLKKSKMVNPWKHRKNFRGDIRAFQETLLSALFT
jgi:hypothetical protein